MACQGCPACKAILSQANAKWPERNKASDGMCASQQHSSANPSSDHEPDSRGLAHATDLTHDPAHGCDAHKEGERIRDRHDRRIKYKISRRRICSYYAVGGYPPWAERPYSGSNPHDKHCHFSIRREFENDVSSWFDDEEDDLPYSEQQLRAIVLSAVDERLDPVEAKVNNLTVKVAEIQSVTGLKTYAPDQTLIKALVRRVDNPAPGESPFKEHLDVLHDKLDELLNRQAEMEERLLAIEAKLDS